MDKYRKFYKALTGDKKGQIGEMYMRFCDPSYDDIGLEFDDGQKRVYHSIKNVGFIAVPPTSLKTTLRK